MPHPRSYRIELLNGIVIPESSPLHHGNVVGADVLGPDAVIVRSAKVNTDAYPRLLAVARAGAGYDNITVDAATQRGIPVFTAAVNANAVAELALGMFITSMRNVFDALEFTKNFSDPTYDIAAVAEREKSRFAGFEIAGKTLLVVGLGNVGVLVANKAHALGMHVIGYDPEPTVDNVHRLSSNVLRALDLHSALCKADVVSVHVPLSPRTRNYISTGEIGLLKPGCVLVNFAREGIYDEEAVLEGIKEGVVKCYITDFPNELLVKNPHGVLMTPHLGASTTEATQACIELAASRINAFLRYGTVEGAVNFPSVALPQRAGFAGRLSIVNRDVPDMLGTITHMLGLAGINIGPMTHEPGNEIGYSLIDTTMIVPETLLTDILNINAVLKARVITLPG